jgi:hypothetical protein
MAPAFIAADPQGRDYLAQLDTLLGKVAADDRTGVEAVVRSLNVALVCAGQLSWLERPNHDFVRYLAERHC